MRRLVAAATGALMLALPAMAPAQEPSDLEERTNGFSAGESPRIAELQREITKGDQQAEPRFWLELAGKGPLVECDPAGGRLSRVTYVWRGDAETRSVFLLGGIPSREAPGAQKPLQRLTGSDLWRLTETIPNTARFTYSFIVNGTLPLSESYEALAQAIQKNPPRIDPLNPRAFAGQSVLELPQAPPQPYLTRREQAPVGTLTQHRLRSAYVTGERAFAVYTPPNYAACKRKCDLLVLFDGDAYGQAPEGALIPTPTILDNLIAAGRIQPVVAVLVTHTDQRTRDQELSCDPAFTDFVARELVPWVQARYRVSRDPARAVVGGSSLGGLNAAYAAFRAPHVFANVLSQSGSYWHYPGWQMQPTSHATETGWLIRQFARRRRLPIRFYLEVGQFEVFGALNMVAENRRFRDVLQAKGYRVTYSEFVGGHDYLCWRGSLAEGLAALLGSRSTR